MMNEHHELCPGKACTCEPDALGHLPSCVRLSCICTLLSAAEDHGFAKGYEAASRDARVAIYCLHWAYPSATEWEAAYRSGADPTVIPERAVISRRDALDVLDRMSCE
jgi:hypothetical protein